MKKTHLLAALTAIVLGVLALWWYTTRAAKTASPSTAGDDQPALASSEQKRPSSLGQRPELSATRKATAKDVPQTSAEAIARPEYAKNRAMADLRQNYAKGRHDLVITAAKNLLAEDPEQPKVRAYLTMSACASGNESLAKENFESLPPERQTLVADRCSKAGISLR